MEKHVRKWYQWPGAINCNWWQKQHIFIILLCILLLESVSSSWIYDTIFYIFYIPMKLFFKGLANNDNFSLSKFSIIYVSIDLLITFDCVSFLYFCPTQFGRRHESRYTIRVYLDCISGYTMYLACNNAIWTTIKWQQFLNRHFFIFCVLSRHYPDFSSIPVKLCYPRHE